ncbi:MAG TPA: hypothetical protein VJT73_20465, partial [Polyangiaceae bacterium]|nr:hypothetical protein [Polyangiaceae bacterium]
MAALLRALGRHRYLRDADHHLHWSVDEALSHLPTFEKRARAFRELRAQNSDLDLGSRDPRLWPYADTEVVIEALEVFWTPGEAADSASRRLGDLFCEAGIELPEHAPFESDPEDPPHPELVLLDWELFPIDELDLERHAGAIRALELAGEEVDVSAAVYQEATCLSLPELARGAPQGVLRDDFLVWS